MKKNQKIILRKLIIAVLILVAIFVVAYFVLKQQTTISALPDYYKTLSQKCDSKESSSCCISSINKMAQSEYKISTGSCPTGFKENTLKCEDSLKWCEPIE